MKDTGDHKFLPVKLGVTGGAGCGKSVVCDFLESRGLTVLRADDLARAAVEPGTDAYQRILDCFGGEVLSADRTINRRRLRGMIISDPRKKKMLERFVHPAVFALMEKGVEAAKNRHEQVVVVEVPLLFEAGMEGYFDYVLTVTVERKERIRRLMNRDQITQEDAQALIGIQMPESEKIEKSDFIIDNNGTLDQTRRAVDRFYNGLMDQITAAKTPKYLDMGKKIS